MVGEREEPAHGIWRALDFRRISTFLLYIILSIDLSNKWKLMKTSVNSKNVVWPKVVN